MIIFVAIIGVLCLYKIQLPIAKLQGYKNGFFEDYMSLEKTTSIKGIFILIVFIQHAMSYLVVDNNIFDKVGYILINDIISQSMVSCFLLFSGYGVMMSIDKKGYQYIKNIPRKRVLKILIHFDIAILLFYVVGLALGKNIDPIQLIVSLTGWESIGNSNWYIFDILILYLLTFISFIVFKNKKIVGLIVNVMLCGILLLVLREFKDLWWYDTILCYPAGMIFYYLKPYLDNILMKNKALYWIAMVVLFIVLVISFKFKSYFLALVIKNVVFAITVVFITMKFSINNKILYFLGKHLFSIYILQRIPMILLSQLGLNSNNYLFVLLSFVVTLIISLIFDYLMNKFDSLIFKDKSVKISN